MSQPRNWKAGFSAVPANAWLGLCLVRMERGESEVRLQPREEFTQEAGVVHGGVLGALADTTAAYCLLDGLEPHRSTLCAEYKTNFLRPATVDGGELAAVGKTLQRGRKLTVAEVDVTQAGKRVARATFTYIHFDRE